MTLLLAGACHDVPESPPQVEQLTRRFGCADVVFVAGVTEFKTAFLVVHTPDLLSQARAAGATQTTTFSLPDARVRVELVTGRNLHEPCDDIVLPGERRDAIYRPTGGTATFTIVPGPGSPPEPPGQGTLELQGVILESESNDHVVDLDGFVIGPTAIGWLAG